MTKDWRCEAFDNFITWEFHALPHSEAELNKAMKTRKTLDLKEDLRDLDWNNYTTNFLIDFGADNNGDPAPFWADRRAPIILSQIKQEFELMKNEDKSEVAKEKKTYVEEDEEYSPVPKRKTQRKKHERDTDDEEVVIPPGVRKSMAKSLPSKVDKPSKTKVAKKSKAKSVTSTDEVNKLAEKSVAETSTAKSVPAKGKEDEVMKSSGG
ncbi:hypothetical protein JAAARDRAFT_187419 [Jaapia argillacea MUCL 33604]|uniref:Uncharacterized protein n=1 Tax=Jaapia argillacea MUCL 33604 TaxID=933084 RepID=A0A067QAR1_9AGAM|nr:hypothetical protein JAAARDRAFT_187419 [Jaapia argillacea MUCL 33604]